jgi:hypothetical protein
VIDVLAAFGEPDVTASHGEVEAAFVEEHELLDRKSGDLPPEGLALCYDGRA